MNDYRDTKAIIDLDHLVCNIKTIYSKSQKPLMAIIKANAYGHGDVKLAKVFDQLQEIKMYGLATIKEAIDLKEAGICKDMLVIGPTRSCDALAAANYGITLSVYSYEYAQELSKVELSCCLNVHIKLDTGMNRIGLRSREELKKVMALLEQNPKIHVSGVFTHFGASEEENSTYEQQISRFKKTIEGYDFACVHADNTAGTMYHHDDFTNMDRLGIGMYGVDPKGIVNPELFPVMTLKTKIALVKKVPKGEKIGYNFTYQTTKDEYIATLPIGYADGFIRKNQGRYVYIKGCQYQIVGRICMDQMMVRVDETIKAGDEVELFGEHIRIEQMAKDLETIPYEIMCLISPRVLREYKKNGSYA